MVIFQGPQIQKAQNRVYIISEESITLHNLSFNLLAAICATPDPDPTYL